MCSISVIGLIVNPVVTPCFFYCLAKYTCCDNNSFVSNYDKVDFFLFQIKFLVLYLNSFSNRELYVLSKNFFSFMLYFRFLKSKTIHSLELPFYDH